MTSLEQERFLVNMTLYSHFKHKETEVKRHRLTWGLKIKVNNHFLKENNRVLIIKYVKWLDYIYSWIYLFYKCISKLILTTLEVCNIIVLTF